MNEEDTGTAGKKKEGGREKMEGMMGEGV